MCPLPTLEGNGLTMMLKIVVEVIPGDLVTSFGGLGRKNLTPYPATAHGLRYCLRTPCIISIAKTQQIIPCLPRFLLLNEHSSRPDEILPRFCHVEFENKAARRPRAVVGYGVKIFLPSPPSYVTRSPGLGA